MKVDSKREGTYGIVETALVASTLPGYKMYLCTSFEEKRNCVREVLLMVTSFMKIIFTIQ